MVPYAHITHGATRRVLEMSYGTQMEKSRKATHHTLIPMLKMSKGTRTEQIPKASHHMLIPPVMQIVPETTTSRNDRGARRIAVAKR